MPSSLCSVAGFCAPKALARMRIYRLNDTMSLPGGKAPISGAGEIERLLDACRASRNPCPATIVTLAVHTGLRKGEILGLEVGAGT
jgi:integrase